MEEQLQILREIDQKIQELPLETRVPVVALKPVNEKANQLDKEETTLQLAVNQKYTELIKPLLQRAAELINGSPPRPEQLVQMGHYMKAGQFFVPLKGTPIPKYWAIVLSKSEISQQIKPHDLPALQNLLNIQIVQLMDTHITYNFIFKPNSYFVETTVKRTLRLAKGQPVRIEGDQLISKPGQWLTHQAIPMMSQDFKSVILVRGPKVESFFDIFLDWSVQQENELVRCEKIMKKLNKIVSSSWYLYMKREEMGEAQIGEELAIEEGSEG